MNLEKIRKYVRATNYISAVQIYLGDNFLLEKKLSSEHIKSRLLGHWGTCPGINFVYANLNRLVIENNLDMMFILGPGHGFPALQANLFVEGTLGLYDGKANRDIKGLGHISRSFSWPYGYPSHSNPEAPGVILEGGELGYSLATAWGTVLDNTGLVTACLIGDGEAETGPTATAWHLSKFVNPKKDGAVLPILHLNGYKISGPTIFGRMKNEDLMELFTGYGYEPIMVDQNSGDIYEIMYKALDQAFQKIKELQTNGKNPNDSYPRFPMIILRTVKGWTGIKELGGERIEDNHLSHQVVGVNAKTDPKELEALEEWLVSYNFKELWQDDDFIQDIKDLVPEQSLAIGNNKHTFGMKYFGKNLKLPEITDFTEEAENPGTIGSSSMVRIGHFLNEVFIMNEENKNFRLFSPDETYSNKLHSVFKSTKRSFQGPIAPWDKDMGEYGRVIEMLSEHSLQAMMQGYILTGRHAIFASYEAFIQVVSSMADQYAKFLRIARDVSWRGDVPSFNYILTSSGWRQEHNGFSHQNPGFIDSMLQKQGCFVKVYFPPDGNSALEVTRTCLESKNQINIIVAGKTLEPRWLTPELAKKEAREGLMIWDFASDDDPDLVFSAAGEYLTKEALAGIKLLKEIDPKIKLRFVNILEISSIGIGNSLCKVPMYEFEHYFTKEKPVIFNFHGYPETLKQVLFDHQDGSGRFFVHGYVENGSTTTPFDLHIRNGTSRYNLVIEALTILAKMGSIDSNMAETAIEQYNKKIKAHKEYIIRYGVDPDEIENWKW
jgi:xylulose-5-phosphate/fructose-6-phosphate phosphoketolase